MTCSGGINTGSWRLKPVQRLFPKDFLLVRGDKGNCDPNCGAALYHTAPLRLGTFSEIYDCFFKDFCDVVPCYICFAPVK